MRFILPAVMPSLVVLLNPLECAESQESSDIRWSGWVLSDVVADEDNEVLTAGEIAVTDPDGEHLSDGIPSESSPGFYGLDVDPNTEIALRITGPTIHPTVWRTRTPRADGYWLYGALFGVDIEGLDLTLDQIEDLTEDEIPWPADGAGALIYGVPTYRDTDDQEAWTGASLTAFDGEGQQGQVVLLAQDLETGQVGLAAGNNGILGPNQVAGPIVMFIAYDLAPGPVRLIADGSDGRSAVADWIAQDGDVLSAFHLTLPETD